MTPREAGDDPHRAELVLAALRHGVPAAADEVRLKRGDGQSYLGTPDDSHGTPLAVTLFDDRPGHAAARIDTVVRRVARRMLRMAATQGADPDWSYDGHALIVAHAASIGLDRAALAQACRDAARRDRNGPIPIHRAHGGIVHTTGIAVTDGMTIWDDDGVTVMLGWALPDTVVAVARGRLLSEIASHPVIEAAGPLRVTNAFVDGANTLLRLEDRYLPLGEVPRGVDAAWRRIAYHDAQPDHGDGEA